MTQTNWMTPECAALPFEIRREVEDFEVQELPLYPATGEGGHLYITIEKNRSPRMRAGACRSNQWIRLK